MVHVFRNLEGPETEQGTSNKVGIQSGHSSASYNILPRPEDQLAFSILWLKLDVVPQRLLELHLCVVYNLDLSVTQGLSLQTLVDGVGQSVLA